MSERGSDTDVSDDEHRPLGRTTLRRQGSVSVQAPRPNKRPALDDSSPVRDNGQAASPKRSVYHGLCLLLCTKLIGVCPSLRGRHDVTTYSFRRSQEPLTSSPVEGPSNSESASLAEAFEAAKAAMTEAPGFYRHPYKNKTWQSGLSRTSSGSSQESGPSPLTVALEDADPPMYVTNAADIKPPLNGEQSRFVKYAMQGGNLYVTGPAGEWYLYRCGV